MPDQIFISYRRNDAAYVTGHINDRLRREFGDEAVFTDVDNLALGVDFRTVLDETVAKCHILLAVIGDSWIAVKNEDGRPRLHDPADFVRIEIESALQRNIPVIPLLVAGTKMPTEDELPDSLRNLAFRNGTQIRPAPDFHTDMDRLIKNLNKHLRSIRANENDEIQSATASPDGPGDGRNPDQALADVSPKRDADAAKSGFAYVDVRLEDDDKTRKQFELGTAPGGRKKRSAVRTLLLIVGLLVAAGAASFVYVKYQEQVQTTNAALASIKKTAADAQAKRESDAIAAAQRAADVAVEAEREAAALAAPAHEAEALAEANDENGIMDETVPAAAVDPGADPEANAKLLAAAQAILDADAGAKLEADAEAEAKREADAIDESRRAARAQVAAEQRAAAAAESKRKYDATTALREGVSFAGFGDHAAAIQKFDEAIRLGIETPAFVYRQRGASYHALGDYQAAIKDFDEVLRMESQDANIHYKRGASNYALQDYEAAINDCNEAIRLDPEFAAAYSIRSAANESLGKLDEAERDRAMVEQIQSGRNDSP
jgi:tetratricopeptide (TPR) repeat protein